MKEFVIYRRTTEEIVKAEYWEVRGNLLQFFNKLDGVLVTTVAVFNINNIDGFKEKL